MRFGWASITIFQRPVPGKNTAVVNLAQIIFLVLSRFYPQVVRTSLEVERRCSRS